MAWPVRSAAAQVPGALEETDARGRRKALQVGETEDGRPFDQPVDQQLVAVRVDLGYTAVMTLEVQVGRCDRAA